MAIVAIIGLLGTGKTLALTYFAFKHYLKGERLYASYCLKYPLEYNHIRTLEEFKQMHDGIFFGDELWSWTDCRTSKSKMNKIITNILLRSRKRRLDIYYSSQFFKQPDKRLRELSQVIIKPSLNKSKTVCTLKYYSLSENGSFVLTKIEKFNTEPIFNLYDTNEEVEMIEDEKDENY